MCKHHKEMAERISSPGQGTIFWDLPKDHDVPLSNAWLLPAADDVNGYFGAMGWYVLLLVGGFMNLLYIFVCPQS